MELNNDELVEKFMNHFEIKREMSTVEFQMIIANCIRRDYNKE